VRAIREAYPAVHFTAGLSNISFGLPARSYINRAFLTLALEAGLDSAILDPLDRELRATLLATELVLGRDRHCLNYTRAFRAGVFDNAKGKE
jgi:5-methyltetrahydrofolate--homocysteine methyltransferase